MKLSGAIRPFKQLQKLFPHNHSCDGTSPAEKLPLKGEAKAASVDESKLEGQKKRDSKPNVEYRLGEMRVSLRCHMLIGFFTHIFFNLFVQLSFL